MVLRKFFTLGQSIGKQVSSSLSYLGRTYLVNWFSSDKVKSRLMLASAPFLPLLRPTPQPLAVRELPSA